MHRLVLSCALVVLFASPALTQESHNWANWRGPNYNGSLPDAHPPTEWSDKQNIKWKTAVPGKGSGSPVIWGDRIYLTTAIETEREGQPDLSGIPLAPSRRSRGFRGRGGPPRGNQAGQGDRGAPPNRGRGGFPGGDSTAPSHYYQFVVLAFDRSTGTEVWRNVVKEAVPHEVGHDTNTYASGSPVTDGERIFVSFGSFGVYCLDMQGNQVWSADLGKMRTRNAFGEASTPVLYGDTLIVPWDQDGYEDRTETDSEIRMNCFHPSRRWIPGPAISSGVRRDQQS